MDSQSMVRSRTGLLAVIGAVLLAVLSSCARQKTLSTEELKRLDEMIQEAMWQYDEQSYNKAYELTGLALEMKPTDLHARLIRGWTLVQTGRYEQWIDPQTRNPHKGARQIFEEVLKDSPNEFRARQGLAAINFRSYYEFQRRDDQLNRMADNFAELRRMAQELTTPGMDRDTRSRRSDDFYVRWRRVNEGYRQERAKTHNLFDDPETKEPIEIDGWKSKDWVNEELMLDAIAYHVNPQRQAWLRSIENLEYFEMASRRRGTFWELQALSQLTAAKHLYEDLERTGSEYYLTLYDLGLVNMALGEYFLRKALVEAEADFKRQRPGVKIPVDDQEEVIASFFADETLHRNPRRDLIQKSFAEAVRLFDAFVKADKESELRADQAVERARFQFSSSNDQNAVTQEILGLYEQETRQIQKERRERRKDVVLNMLVVLIYPQYLNQDLPRAQTLTNELTTTDLQDPVPYLIRGVVFERMGQYERSVGEYERFLQTSGPAMYLNRRRWVRDRITRLNLELERERIEGRR
jgi:Tfp pilus assembly protein PilF